MPDLRSLGLTFLSGCLLLGSGALLAGTGNRTDAPATLPGTQAFVLASPETGRDYLIQVAVPRRQPPAEGYPVLYVLDGNARFALTLAARDTLFSGSPADLPSPWLIVAIGYPGTDRFDTDARAEDYTPPAQRLDDTGDPNNSPQGGAERFLAFLEARLKPAIADRFPIDARRSALLGHSYGGLFTLYTLLEHPGAFRDYIAVSPSLWWNRGYLLERLTRLDRNLAGRRLLIGVGGEEQSPRPGEPPEKSRRRQANAMVDNARTAATRLRHHAPGLSVRFLCFPGEDHGTVVWPAMRAALAQLHEREVMPGGCE